MRNGEESVYHADEKGYTIQTLQQYQKTKYLVPQAQQSVVWRNRPCLRTSTSSPPDRPSSLETQHHQSTTLNKIIEGKEKIHTPANTYLHIMANTQTAQLGQPRDHHSNINSRGHQQQPSKSVRRSDTRSPDSGVWKHHPDTWKRILRWSTRTPKLGPNQLQPSPTILGKFSHSFPYNIPLTHIRNLLFLSNNHSNKKY